MEYMGAISEGTWNSFSGGMCSEEADFMSQLLGNCSLPNDAPHYTLSSNFWPANTNNADADEGSMHSSDETNTSMYLFSQGSGDSRGGSIHSHDGYYPGAPHQILFANSNLMTMNYYMTDDNNISSQFHVLSNNVMEGDDFLNQEVSNDSMESNEIAPQDFFHGRNLGSEIEMPMMEVLKEEKISCPTEVSKKRSRAPSGEVQRSKKSMKLKKCQKAGDNDEDINKNNAALHRPSSSSCCSEDDDSNASQELNGVNSTSSGIPKSGKARASRGSATDPQSLYARKRRERINERLRILQNLVPNGTKVDISTMLEEAVQYVKFLQLQIKLLSSDDHWMYAPLAYNGMDIGLDLKISALKS